MGRRADDLHGLEARDVMTDGAAIVITGIGLVIPPGLHSGDVIARSQANPASDRCAG